MELKASIMAVPLKKSIMVSVALASINKHLY